MKYQAVAAQLEQDLELDTPPVHISYLDTPPKGVPEHPGGAPSACTFWAEGRTESFYAPLAKHDACEIGGMPARHFAVALAAGGARGGDDIGLTHALLPSYMAER